MRKQNRSNKKRRKQHNKKTQGHLRKVLIETIGCDLLPDPSDQIEYTDNSIICRFFRSLNLYVSTGDCIGQGMLLETDNSSYGTCILVNMRNETDQDDYRKLECRLADAPMHISLESMGTTGEFREYMITFPKERIEELTDFLKSEPGPLGWGSTYDAAIKAMNIEDSLMFEKYLLFAEEGEFKSKYVDIIANGLYNPVIDFGAISEGFLAKGLPLQDTDKKIQAPYEACIICFSIDGCDFSYALEEADEGLKFFALTSPTPSQIDPLHSGTIYGVENEMLDVQMQGTNQKFICILVALLRLIQSKPDWQIRTTSRVCSYGGSSAPMITIKEVDDTLLGKEGSNHDR